MADYNQELLMRFIVGEASADERSSVEQRFIEDQEFFDALCALEHEMILALVRNELSPRWAGPLTDALNASPDRRRHLDEIRGMVAAVAPAAATPVVRRRRPLHSWGLQAAAVAIAGVGLAMFWWGSRPAPAPDLMTAVQPPVAAPVVDRSATFVLLPGPTRSSSTDENVVRIPRGAEQVRFIAVLEGTAMVAVEADIRKIGGGRLDVASATAVRELSQGLEVTWLVPSAALPDGDYVISYDVSSVSGVPQTIASRYLRVVR